MSPIQLGGIFLPTFELGSDIDADSGFHLTSASMFTGRLDILLNAAKSIARPEGCVAFIGERGVGKSSVGHILMNLLNGTLKPNDIGLPVEFRPSQRVCLRAAWTPDTISLEHLLYRLFDPTREAEGSFARLLPKIAGKCLDKFNRISLKELTVEAATSNGTLQPNQVLVHDLLNTIEEAYVAALKRSDTQSKYGLAIVIDELEEAKKRGGAVGLGRLIKNSKFQFITIGIGSDVADILDDHPSAARKFTGGTFLLEPLTQLDTRELFMKATTRAASLGAKISFSDKFCDLVHQDFFGYPAPIQVFGYDIINYYATRLEGGDDIKLGEAEYKPLMELRERSTYFDVAAMNTVIGGIDAKNTRWEILKTMVAIRDTENSRWITLDKIRKKLPRTFQDRIHDHLKVLVEKAVLRAQDRDITVVQFTTPAILVEIKRLMRKDWNPKAKLNK